MASVAVVEQAGPLRELDDGDDGDDGDRSDRAA
jgi:hypothetical protein